MRWLRLLFRIFGWLLTPFLAWAASFFGAVGGALIAMKLANPIKGLAVTALCGPSVLATLESDSVAGLIHSVAAEFEFASRVTTR